jgi:EAL domain-containing protein (putative c-di-GMP-specific phosphodiesterase class I)
MPMRTPDLWFQEAAEAGLGAKLELAAIRKALSTLPDFPQNIYISVNASPDTILCDDIEATMDGVDLDRIVLEITEHARVESYARLNMALAPLRARGLRIAIDDAGAGYASLQHILQLRPDIIKLDMGLTRSIDLDPARRALAMALIGFAYQLNSTIVAEGVETESELKTLKTIGIEAAQGYLLGRPMPHAEALALFARNAPSALVA